MFKPEILTPELSNELCNTVFSEDIKEALSISLPAGRKITLAQQFYSHYRDRVLSYSKEDTIIEMASICDYSQQEIKKFKLYKSKLDILNSPESFFLTRLNNAANVDNTNTMNTEKIDNAKETKTLSLSRGDSESAIVNKSLVRTGNSAFNEDFNELESDWDKRDKNLEDVSKNRNLLDINTDNLNLDSITVAPTLDEKKQLEESETATSDVAYTNVALNKSVVNNKTGSINTSKNYNSARDKNLMNKNSLMTGVSNKQSKSIQLEFSYNEATINALNTYVSNFRESFLNSFSSLFTPYWMGYGR